MRRPVVLLHGVLRSPRDWDAVAARLRAAGWEVHAPALPEDPVSPQGAFPEAAALLRGLAPGGAHLVGHSRGGTLASWLAAEAPEVARSLAVVASPPQASEAFRAHFRRENERRPHPTLAYLARIPEDDFPTHALRRYAGPALVVEAGDDPLYSPTHTLFWRAFLPYAAFERFEAPEGHAGGHAFFARDPGAAWLAGVLLRHLEAAERA